MFESLFKLVFDVDFGFSFADYTPQRFHQPNQQLTCEDELGVHRWMKLRNVQTVDNLDTQGF